jgi:1,2-dihydroxy-3-keto-5-methylthiopentene dioxygenase
MTQLAIFHENHPKTAELISDPDHIAQKLKEIGVVFERWETKATLEENASQADVLSAYLWEVAGLKEKYGFKSADVISVDASHPDRAALRQKFLAEHRHSDFEVRFFVEGRGLFYLHPDDHVYAILCEKGDLLSVPAWTKHWFDLGETPHLKCIRLFTDPAGWVANFTGNPIAESFHSLETFALVTTNA